MSDQVTAAPVADTSAPAEANQENGEGQQTEGQEPAAPAAPKKKAPVYKKYKIGNEEVALSDEDIARDYSKWKGADAKARETAEARKALDSFMERLQADPESVLSDPKLPLDRKKLAEKWLVKQLEDELNPPDPRDAKLTETEKRLKEYEDKEAAAKEAAEAEETTRVVAKRREDIGNVLREAGKLTPLSASPESEASLIREMAMYMRAAKERGESPTAQEVAEHIHNTRFNQFYTLAHQFEGPELIDFLGDEIVNRIRKADLARLRGAREPEAQHRNTDGARPRDGKPAKRLDSFNAAEALRNYGKS